MLIRCLVPSLILTIAPLALAAGELELEMAEGLPEGVAAEITEQLQPRHVKLRVGGERDLCEIWIAKSWKLGGQAQSDGDKTPILFSFTPGSLVGVMRLASVGLDLRDEEVPAGFYTLRYVVQPEFDEHLDSHDSRDFLLLLSPEVDKSAAPLVDGKPLYEQSSSAVQREHPGFLPLLKPADAERAESIRPDPRDPDGSVLLLHGQDEGGKKVSLEIILLREAEGG